MNAQNAQLLFFGAIIIVIVALMFRNSRKRSRDQLALAEGLKPGAEIMTTFGLFGTIVSIDEQENRITLQTGPGSQATIHRQALGRIVTPVAGGGAQLNGEPVAVADGTTDPAFGERSVDLTKNDDAGRGTVRRAD